MKMITETLPGDGLILCAVSGGVDSMYLLCRLTELGCNTAAAHFNHGLRGAESDRDEAFVADFCRERGIPFLSERGDAAAYAERERLGLEEAARILRYDFLERAADELHAEVIATAHSADDNAETVLMHLVRGSGLRGLSGIPVRRGRVVRPMLDTSRREAERYLEQRGIPHIEDSSNREDLFLRNRLRHKVMPLLMQENPSLPETVGRTAALLREDEWFLESLAEDFLRQQGEEEGISAPSLLSLPRSVARRVVRLMAGDIGAEQTESILRAAKEGGAAEMTGMRVARWRDRLYFGVREAERLPDRELLPDSELDLPEAGMKVRCEKIFEFPASVNKSLITFFFQCANIGDSIFITARKPGDRFRPVGRGCSKTLKAVFEELGVPPWRRDSIPILRDGAGVLAVCGAAPGERAYARPGDRDLLKIEFIRRETKGEGFHASGC